MLHVKPAIAPSRLSLCRCQHGFRRSYHDHFEYGQTTRSAVKARPRAVLTSEDGSKTLHLRRDGKASLPLPPILDPVAVAARERHRVRKESKAGQALTPFQRDLISNPYAQALATRVRQCNITKARVPTHFLQAFSSVYSEDGGGGGADSSQDGGGGGGGRRPVRAHLVPSPPQKHAASRDGAGATSYVLNRRDMLEFLGRKKTCSEIANPIMREHYARRTVDRIQKPKDNWAWAADMPERVLERLRSAALLKLREWVETRPELSVPVKEGGELPEDASCVLMLPGAGGGDCEYPGLRCYNLLELLGDAACESLPDQIKLHSKWIMLKHRQLAHVQAGFERVQAYQRSNHAR